MNDGLPVQASPARADIARQPATVATFAARAGEFAALGREGLAPGAGGRLWAGGCGDGYFAALAAQGFAADCGLDWRATGALDLALGTGRLRAGDRAILISMSGNVDRTVEAANALARARVPTLALVNGKGGRLGEIAAWRVSLDLSDVAPFLCGTASYTATLAALMAFAAGAAGAAVPDFVAVARAQEAALAASDAVLSAIPVPTGVRWIAAGAEIGTAQYAAAKLVELTRVPAWHADLEEFAHSQYWAMPTTDLVAILAADPALAAYAEPNCAALAELGVRTLAIETAAAPVASATWRIAVPALDATLMPLVCAIPAQLFAMRLARATGLDPDTRAHLKGDAPRFRTSRMLTRRSLLGTGA
jgi:fructoselysine-6-P-deglycase FrlB-like protein